MNGAQRTKRRRNHIITRDGRCLICGGVDSLTVHHIRPKAIGGTNQPHNLVAVCLPCHQTINTRMERVAAWSMWGYSAVLQWRAWWQRKVTR